MVVCYAYLFFFTHCGRHSWLIFYLSWIYFADSPRDSVQFIEWSPTSCPRALLIANFHGRITIWTQPSQVRRTATMLSLKKWIGEVPPKRSEKRVFSFDSFPLYCAFRVLESNFLCMLLCFLFNFFWSFILGFG